MTERTILLLLIIMNLCMLVYYDSKLKHINAYLSIVKQKNETIFEILLQYRDCLKNNTELIMNVDDRLRLLTKAVFGEEEDDDGADRQEESNGSI